MYRIFTGDCFEVANYPTKPVDLILFDPPYKNYEAIRKQNRIVDGIKAWPLQNYEHLARLFFMQNLLKPTGRLIFKCDDVTAIKAIPIFEQFFKFQRLVIWDKGRISTGGDPRIVHEFLPFFHLYDQKPFKKTFPPRPPSKWHGNSLGRSFPSIIHLYQPNGGEKGKLGKEFKRVHVNETEKELWEKIIEFFVPLDGTILDVTCGSGSIPAAVTDLNQTVPNSHRNVIAMDINPSYVEQANHVIEDMLKSPIVRTPALAPTSTCAYDYSPAYTPTQEKML